MTGTTRSSDGLDLRRRKIMYRAWHRGMREMDLIVGRFADANIEALADAELDAFERLMDLPDGEVLSWLTGEVAVPAAYDGPLFRRLRDFHLRNDAGA